MAFQIEFWSFFFLSGYGQLQNTVETIMGTTLIIIYFTITIIFFLTIYNEKYHKLMYIISTIGGIIIAILITLNFVWPMLFGMPPI